MDEHTPVFAIAVAAEFAGMHPQTLRQYDRLGLVSPKRTAGQSRRYSMRDVVQLREIARLSAEGLNLEGIKRILELENQVLGAEPSGCASSRARSPTSCSTGPAGGCSPPARPATSSRCGRAPVRRGPNQVVVWRPLKKSDD